MLDTYRRFSREFAVVPATEPDLVDTAFALRYQVYCVEHEYEERSSYLDRRETDPYDYRSVHSLVQHRHSGCFAGVVRLVLPDADDPWLPFPVEACCARNFDRRLFDPAQLPRRRVAEVSRFAVSKTYRRRAGEYDSPAGASDIAAYRDESDSRASSRRTMSDITLGLIAAAVQMSAANGIRYWYAAMEPALLRLLGKIGLHFQAVGPLVEYHGRRQPVMADLDILLSRAHHEHPEVWEVITDCGRTWPLPAWARQAAVPVWPMLAGTPPQPAGYARRR